MRVLDYGLAPRPYIAMEFLDASRLADYLEKKHPTATELVAVCRQLFSALSYLESEKVLHGDVSTLNLLVRDFDNPHLYLVDFGVSNSDSGTKSTGTEYSSAADVQGAGKVLSECLAQCRDKESATARRLGEIARACVRDSSSETLSARQCLHMVENVSAPLKGSLKLRLLRVGGPILAAVFLLAAVGLIYTKGFMPDQSPQGRWLAASSLSESNAEFPPVRVETVKSDSRNIAVDVYGSPAAAAGVVLVLAPEGKIPEAVSVVSECRVDNVATVVPHLADSLNQESVNRIATLMDAEKVCVFCFETPPPNFSIKNARARIVVNPDVKVGASLPADSASDDSFYIIDSQSRAETRKLSRSACERAFVHGSGRQLMYSSPMVSTVDTETAGARLLHALVRGFIRSTLLNDEAARSSITSQEAVKAQGSSATLRIRR